MTQSFVYVSDCIERKIEKWGLMSENKQGLSKRNCNFSIFTITAVSI